MTLVGGALQTERTTVGFYVISPRSSPHYSSLKGGACQANGA